MAFLPPVWGSGLMFPLCSVVCPKSYVRFFVTPWTAAYQASLSFTISRVCSNSCPLNWWCHLTISSFVAPLSSCPQSFPASGSFPVSWLFTSDDHSIGTSVLESVLLMKIQGWLPLGLTGLVSLQFQGPSRVFSNTTIQNHEFFSAQPSFWSNSYMTTGKTIALTIWIFVSRVMSLLFNMLSWFVIAFLPRNKCLLIL